jgi:hypothetical protein
MGSEVKFDGYRVQNARCRIFTDAAILDRFNKIANDAFLINAVFGIILCASQGGLPRAADFAASQRSPGRTSGSRRCLPPRRRLAHYSNRALLRLRTGR